MSPLSTRARVRLYVRLGALALLLLVAGGFAIANAVTVTIAGRPDGEVAVKLDGRAPRDYRGVAGRGDLIDFNASLGSHEVSLSSAGKTVTHALPWSLRTRWLVPGPDQCLAVADLTDYFAFDLGGVPRARADRDPRRILVEARASGAPVAIAREKLGNTSTYPDGRVRVWREVGDRTRVVFDLPCADVTAGVEAIQRAIDRRVTLD